MTRVAAAFTVILIASTAIAPRAVAQSAPLSPEQIARIVASPDRRADDRAIDARRQPEHILAFIGIRPSIEILDLAAGDGYTTELLARAAGPRGTVYGQAWTDAAANAPGSGAMAPLHLGRTPPAAITSRAGGLLTQTLADRAEAMKEAQIPAARMVPLTRRFETPVPPPLAAEAFDLVTLLSAYRDLGAQGVDRAAMNLAVFRALKPGGIYVIADQSEDAVLRREVEAAGFTPAAESDVRHTSPGDGFILKFVKP